MRSALLLLLVSASIDLAQAQAPLTGPMEGFTFDAPTRSVRPVIGSLGSASLGQPVLRAAYGSVAPRQNYALVFQGDRCTLVTGLGSENRSSIEAAGSFSVPDGVTWTGDGTTAILYSRTGNWIQILSGLPSGVSVGPAISLSSLTGTLSSVTTDFHGDRVLIGLLGEAGGVYQVTNAGTFVPLMSTVRPVSMTLTDDGKTLYALDSATAELVEQNMADLSSQSWPLDGLADAVALVAAKDAEQRGVIYVAGRSDRLLKVFDAFTGAVLASIPLNFQPNAIEPLGGNSFLLGSRLTNDDILWSFTNASQPAVYFVPAMSLHLQGNTAR